MRGVSLSDRIISALSYYTMGIVSIIWIIYSNLVKKSITPYLMYNFFQAIFLSIALAIISLMYSIAVNFLVGIPFIGAPVKSFHVFFMETPRYFGFTISGFIVTFILTYLAFFCLIGKRPYLPCISDTVNSNFRS